VGRRKADIFESFEVFGAFKPSHFLVNGAIHTGALDMFGVERARSGHTRTTLHADILPDVTPGIYQMSLGGGVSIISVETDTAVAPALGVMSSDPLSSNLTPTRVPLLSPAASATGEVDDTYDDCPGIDYALGSDGAARKPVLRSEVKRDPKVRKAVVA
jgi:hypothetical protein